MKIHIADEESRGPVSLTVWLHSFLYLKLLSDIISFVGGYFEVEIQPNFLSACLSLIFKNSFDAFFWRSYLNNID